SGYYAENRDLGILGESEGLLEAGFARSLSGEVLGTIVSGDKPIHLRAPGPVIGAVQYADQVCGARPKKTLKPKAVLGRLYLTAIGGAHRGDRVGESKASLQKIDFAVKFQMAGRE